MQREEAVWEYWGDDKCAWRKWKVLRKTKTQIICRCNDVAVLRFRIPKGKKLQNGDHVSAIPREKWSNRTYVYKMAL